MNAERAEDMEVTAIQDIFIKMLRSELTGTELDVSVKEQITPDVVSALYSLAVRHDLAHIVASSLHKCGLKSDDAIYAKFNQKAVVSVYRNEQTKYAFAQICDTFNQASIPYIPLKGSVIRPYYPIINLSETENLVTVMTCNEIFSPNRPDTFGEPV